MSVVNWWYICRLWWREWLKRASNIAVDFLLHRFTFGISTQLREMWEEREDNDK